MTSTRPTRSRSEILVLAGLLAFAVGFLLLAAGVLQRHDGRLSWGPRTGPMRTLAREENPVLFDRVTLGLVAAGLLLAAGGLAVGYVAAGPDGRGRDPG